MAAESESQRSFLGKALIVMTLAVLAVVSLFLLWHLSQMLLLVFAGVLLAVFLDSLADWSKRHLRLPHGLALALVLVVLLLLGAGAGWIVGPALGNQMSGLADRIPEAFKSLESWLQQSDFGQALLSTVPSMQELLPSGAELLGGVTGAFSTVLGVVGSAVILVFIGFYLAVAPDEYRTSVLHMVPKQYRRRAGELLDSLGEALRWWLLGRILSMIIVGLLTMLGLWIAGVPLAPALGLIAAILSFVPFIGPFLSAIPMVLVALAESPVLVLWALGVYLLVQFLESYLVTPLIQKRTVFIPPALLLSFQILMGVLFGVLGIFLATPFLLVVVVLVQMVYIGDMLGENVRILGDHEAKED